MAKTKAQFGQDLMVLDYHNYKKKWYIFRNWRIRWRKW